MQPFVSVVIVNYNSGSYAKICIESLLKQQDVQLEIIIVDNSSKDDSIAILSNAFKSSITLIKSEENLGFARANNLGAAQAKGEFLLLLNPDTEISDSHDIANLIGFICKHPQYGMVGPAIFEPRKSKQVMPRLSYPASKKLKFTDNLKRLPGNIAWLLGACLLFKRSVYQLIAGFDSDYFLYGEDADIGLKIRRAGFEIGYCDTVKIMHISGASEIGADSLDKWLRKKRGVFLFFCKNYDGRDVLEIAKTAITKSKFHLAFIKFSLLISHKSNAKLIDKKHRLEATVIAANEVVERLNSRP